MVDGTHYYSLHKPTSTDWWQNTSDRTLPAPHTAAKLAYPSSRRAPKPLSGEVHRLQLHSSRPGNVRELSNVLVRAIVHSERNSISKSDIENALSIAPMPDDAMNLLDTPLNENFRLNEHLDTITRHFIERAREESDNNLGKASELLGFTNYQTLSSRIKKLGIDW